MSAASFTPGPWTAELYGVRWKVSAVASLGGAGAISRAKVLWDVANGRTQDGEAAEANARLIAAAPELYEALKYFLEDFEHIENPSPGVAHARAAIAKAIGGPQS